MTTFTLYRLLLVPLFMLLPFVALGDVGAPLFGVHVFTPATQASQIKALGAQVVRLPVTWHLMEEAGAGQTAQWFWDQLDADVAAVEGAGAKLIIELGQTPCWASSDPNKHCQDASDSAYLHYPPTDVNDYAKAIARLAERYKGRVLAYEIWNEPNFTGNWPPYPARSVDLNDDYASFVDLAAAPQYAAMVKASYVSLKAADPDAKVVAGSIAGGDVGYVQALYTAGIKGYFDALSMHPYTDVYPGGKDSFGPAECPEGIREPRFWCFQVGVEGIRQAMLAAGDDKPVWFTEFGFDSNTAWNGSGLVGQAEHLRQALDLIKSWAFVSVVCWYELVDRDSSKNQREYQFGLFDSQLQLKPAGTMFKNLLAGVAGADIGLSKGVSKTHVKHGETVVYSLTVTNTGAAATGVQVTDRLPMGLRYISDDSGGNYDKVTGVWRVGDLLQGASKMLNMTVVVQ